MATITPPFSVNRPEILYLASAMASLVIAVTVGLQPLFLDEYFGISFENSGTINAHLLVMTQLVGLALTISLNSIIRTHPLILAFLIASIGALLAPFSHLFGAEIGLGGLLVYYFSRTLVACGTEMAQWQLAALTTQLPTRRHTTHLLTAMMVMMVVGAVVVGGILLQIPLTQTRLFLAMMIPILASLVAAVMIKRSLNPENLANPGVADESLFGRVVDVISADVRLQLSLATAFFVRADFIGVNLFFSLWCVSFADLVGITRGTAVAHAGWLLLLTGLALLAAIPFWRYFMARSSRISTLGISLSIGSMGFLLLSRIIDPFNGPVLGPLIMIGVGHSGCLMAAQTLAAELTPQPLLKPMQRLFQLTSGLGLIFLVQSGGYYFDAVGPQTPFTLMGSGYLFLTMYALWMVANHIDEHADHTLIKHHRPDMKPLLFMFCLVPITWLVGRVLITGYAPGSSLGQMPVGFINRYLGDWAFNFSLISLAWRPLSELAHRRSLLRYSRMIGLYAFFYATLHVMTYLWLEWVFKWDDILNDIHKRPFIYLGLIAFVLLVLLSITSLHRVRRWMGHRAWKRLHQTVFLINLLVALHFILAASHDNGEPYAYAGIVLLLIAYRGRNRLNPLRSPKE
ncbi:MAG: sulfoxide reductase heme-binding subunit YedZ [Magnetococcales bacterium]|nr:sulfoxide reductase heme-binding subunit YedZ [Magnetococcales bacterium]MBF0149565.1 sulfoxide reductase heme-binding subunit YedZ [Magnetococcales bacterium]MBF0632078.1 sulfoxide reductase heme-binding subunit YedZ [Magnetococcales bacterium]